MTRIIIAICFIGCFTIMWPLIASPLQDTVDAVQAEKIMNLEKSVALHSELISAINEKMTYTQGGVAGIYALLGIIGIFNLRIIRNKEK